MPYHSNKINLNWLLQHSPIFAEMVCKTQQRKLSEAEYRKLLPPQRLSTHPISPIFSLKELPLDVSLLRQNP